MQIRVIINPVSGAGRGDAVARRVALVSAHLGRCGHEVDVRLTETEGHARSLAADATRAGAELVCAWGGDGTINEVGSVLVGGNVPLAVIPGGSGNGLARELGMPLDTGAALDTILASPVWRMDAGELAGRPFFNVAGIGLDGLISRHTVHAPGARGFAQYVALAVGTYLGYRAPVCTVRSARLTRTTRPLALVFANSRRYGYRALIAPGARVDDGLLEMVTVPHRSAWWTLRHAPALFDGGVLEVPGVECERVEMVTIEGDRPLPCHVDGEPVDVGASVTVRVRPGALLIRAPLPVGRGL